MRQAKSDEVLCPSLLRAPLFPSSDYGTHGCRIMFPPHMPDRYASYFATYEGIKRFLLWRDRNKEDGIMPSPAMVMLKTAASGAAAGVMAWLPVYPGELEYRSNSRLAWFGLGITGVQSFYLCHSRPVSCMNSPNDGHVEFDSFTRWYFHPSSSFLPDCRIQDPPPREAETNLIPSG